MSELERQRRKEYKQNRKKWMLIQVTAIILLIVISLGSFFIYNRMNRTYYIEYTESGSVDYKVYYEENDFFDTEWIDKDQTYISSLIEGMTADFVYRLNTDSSDLGFNYQYKIDAKVIVANKDTGMPYYTYEENIFPPKETPATNASNVQIQESVFIDYNKYNEIAQSFVETYNLSRTASCTLVVTLDVEILSSNKQFNKENQNRYNTSVNIPLTEESINIYTTSSSPDGEVKVLEYQTIADRKIFYISSIVSAALAVMLVLALVIFMHLTKNEDITYTAKIRKILRTYSAYIQRIDGEFECDGYQIIMIKSFIEMLGIRDTIMSPVLMSENADETMTRFLIPTNTNILYVFEIRVDNYDALYAQPEPEEVEEDVVVEEEELIVEEEPELVVLENVDEQELAEAMAQPDVELEEISFTPDDDDQFEVPPEEPGIEVIGVVWPERQKRNKVYRYDPNGESLEKGDIVLVPTYDAAKGRDVIRKVAVAHENHRVDPEHIKHPLKKIVAVVKRSVSHSLTPKANKIAKLASEDSQTEE